MLLKNQGLLRCNFIMATCILLVQFSMSPVSASTYFSDSGSAIGILPGHQYGRTYQSCIAEGYTDCEWPSSAFLYSANGYVCANSGYLWYGYVFTGSYWHNPTNYYLDSGGVKYNPNCITLSPGVRTLSNQVDSTYIILQVGNSNSFVPSASFSAAPLSGTTPLVVQFTDTSVGSPTSWSWSFGDGGTSTLVNPSHTYTTAGTYSVSLTAENSYGDDTETKQEYVTVTPASVNYYVVSDGVRYYHNYENNLNLSGADTTAQYFYDHLTDSSRCHEYGGTNYCWNERSNPVNDNTGSLYWSQTESADSIGANSAEFTFHAGHGWEDGILFGTANNYHKVFRTNMSFSRAKWVALDSCQVLNQSNQSNWESVFDGLHILMGFDTTGLVNEDTGPQFVERMRGGTYQGTPYQVYSIRDSWKLTLQDTLQDSSLKGAYMWADPSGDDYLPGYGPFEEPTKSNGEYLFNWSSFACDLSG